MKIFLAIISPDFEIFWPDIELERSLFWLEKPNLGKFWSNYHQKEVLEHLYVIWTLDITYGQKYNTSRQN